MSWEDISVSRTPFPTADFSQAPCDAQGPMCGPGVCPPWRRLRIIIMHVQVVLPWLDHGLYYALHWNMPRKTGHLRTACFHLSFLSWLWWGLWKTTVIVNFAVCRDHELTDAVFVWHSWSEDSDYESQSCCFSAVSVPELLTPGSAASAEQLREPQWELFTGYELYHSASTTQNLLCSKQVWLSG